MILPLTSLYAGLLTFIVLVLAYGVGAKRGKSGVSLGDGGDVSLLEAIRKHGNAIEYVPLALILFALLEANDVNAWLLHAAGVALVAGRIAHPLGLQADNMAHPLRAIGSGLTVLVMFLSAAYLAGLAVGHLLGS